MSLINKTKELFGGNLYRNTLYNIGSKGIAMLLYMLTDIGIARLTSVNEYGEWSYFYSLISMIFWIAWFGINSSSKVFIAKFSGQNHIQNQYLKSALLLRAIVSVGIICIYYLCLFFLKKRIVLMNNYPSLYKMLLFGGGLVFCSSFSDFFKELNIGLIKFEKNFIIACLEYGGYLFFGVGLLWILKNLFSFNNYITGVVIGYTLSLAIVTLYGYYTIKKRIKYNIKINYKYMKEIFTYAIPILIMSFGALIMLELDVIMIGSIYKGEQVAIYSVAKKICSKATHINIAICTATMTEFVIINKSNIHEKKKLFARLMKINGEITFGLVFIFIFIVPFLIPLFYGKVFNEAYKILYSLLPYFIMNSFSLFMSNLMDYQKKAKVRSIFYIIMLILDIVLNAAWIPKYGAIGAAWATSVSIVPYFLLLILSTINLFYSYERKQQT